MKRVLCGFTIIEVSLFLGITALLFVGVTVGMNASITRQRYSDAVDNFADFLRNIYSEVSNPQSGGNGQSKQAIYGKLVSFGQSKDFAGNNNEKSIFVYDVVGDVNGNFGDGTLQSALKELNASVLAYTPEKTATQLKKTYAAAGRTENYLPKWDSRIEGSAKGTGIKAEVLVVRHPRSGTINTLVRMQNDVIEVNSLLKDISGQVVVCKPNDTNCKPDATVNSVNHFTNTIKNAWSQFSAKEIIFCVNPFSDSSQRRAVKIRANARNASAVELLNLDSEENKTACKE